MTDNETRAAAVRRRNDGMRRLSALTTALAVTSVFGTGAVVYAVSNHASGTTPGTATSSTSGSGTTGTGLQSPATAPGAAQSAPIVTSHGS